MAKLKPECWSWDSRLPMDILEPVIGTALGKPQVALAIPQATTAWARSDQGG